MQGPLPTIDKLTRENPNDLRSVRARVAGGGIMRAPGLNDDPCLVVSYVDLAAETVVQSSIHLALE